MQITRRSPFTGKTHTLCIPVTHTQMALWNNGMLIQDAMPHLTDDQREFIKTGITVEEWDEFMGSDS